MPLAVATVGCGNRGRAAPGALGRMPGPEQLPVRRQNDVPQDVETVYVPVFECSSYRRELGVELTEAVIKEIERRGVYKVVPSTSADTILTGKITTETKHLLFETLTGDPREMELSLAVKVSWTYQRGGTVQAIPPVPVPEAAVNVNAANGLVPEVGHSIATSHQAAIKRLAEQIVSLMEKPW